MIAADSDSVEENGLDRIGEISADEVEDSTSNDSGGAAKPVADTREWGGQHPINLRVTLPLPFRRWYVTLVAGPERRSKDRLKQERAKHPLETLPNLMFLLSIGIVSTTVLVLVTALILINGFGWSIDITVPA